METNRKFVFKLPSSTTHAAVSNSSSTAAASNPPLPVIPFSIKNFAPSTIQPATSSIFNYSNPSSKSQNSNFSKNHQFSNENSKKTQETSSQSKTTKPVNTKLAQAAAAQTTLTSFIAKSTNNSFKKPTTINANSTGNLLTELKDDTDDDWAVCEKKINSPNPQSFNSSSNKNASKTEAEQASCKTKLNFFKSSPETVSKVDQKTKFIFNAEKPAPKPQST